ncbi:hypothetical protein [Phenylobacterium sp.]|uniref:hypothetical protein n=1 Tax=Phenylobacterium sp. TaxID=1871053 RepID=UPI00286B3741|nr:hypothetical protein [Phenylobacterium sp.]
MCGWRWVAAAMVLSLASPAAAQGLSSKVYSPYVHKGVTELELRGGRLNGGPLDGEQAAIVELEQGLNDRVSVAAIAEFEQHAGQAGRLDGVAVEAVVYVGQIPGIGVDVGGYLEYEQRIHNESGVLEGKILLAKQAGGFEALVNLIAKRALTERPGEDDTRFGYAAEATFDVGHRLKLGAQAFGDMGTNRAFGGRRAHYVGPVARWAVKPGWMSGGELELEAAWLLPLGTARADSDSQLRFVMAFERRF